MRTVYATWELTKKTCDRILREGKLRADTCERTMLKDLEANGLLVFA